MQETNEKSKSNARTEGAPTRGAALQHNKQPNLKRRTMKLPISRSLRTPFTWNLLLSLTLICSAVDSAAQSMPNRVRMMLQRSRQALPRPSQLIQTSPSVPTWSFPDAFVNDPDLVPARTGTRLYTIRARTP